MSLEHVALNALGAMTPIMAIVAFSIPLTSKLLKKDQVPFLLALFASVYSSIASTLALYYVSVTGIPLVYTYGGWPPHFGIVYEVDLFNAVFATLTAWIMVAIVLYSHWYRAHLDDSSWYYTLLVGLETGLIGCLYTGDAFNLFVMIEVLGISAYGLVAYHRDRAEAVEAAAKYALIGAVATTIYFMAVVLLYAGYGTVNMALLAGMARNSGLAELRYVSLIAIAFSLWVFTFKAAMFPNHFWLPDAHPEAPTPVSAALSGLVVNVGVYASARFLYTIFSSGSITSGYRETVLLVLFILGATSGLLGALMMMSQRDIKRLLAYSTISHMGLAYMGLAAGFMTSAPSAVKTALAGAVVHVVAHGVAKSMLFMASGVFIDAAGSRDLDKMRGIGRLHPATSLSMIIGFLSLAGFVPLLGFHSKRLIATGYLEGGFVIGPLLIIVISALSLPGYFRAMFTTVFGTRETRGEQVRVLWIEVMLLAMAASLVVLGVFYVWLGSIFESSAVSLVEEVEVYVKAALDRVPIELRGWLP